MSGDHVGVRHTVQKAKVTFLGEYSVGKTSIATRFAKDIFNDQYYPTIGGSFLTRKLTVDDRTFMFQLWDTAGSERYRSLVPMYLRGTSAAIVVYDITNVESFDQLSFWLEQLFKYAPLEALVVIVGNKADLMSTREVSFKSGQDFAELGKFVFFEASAKTGQNITNLFTEIAQRLRNADAQSPETEEDIQLDYPPTSKRTSKCCNVTS